MIRRGCFSACLLLLALPVLRGAAAADPAPDARFGTVNVAPSATSIYVGRVRLNLSPLERQDGAYLAGYTAKVFPFFFFDEHGAFRIAVSDDDLRRLARGETITFTGQAQTSGGAPRRIEGRAVPQDANSGKIKVRVFVSKDVQLIFNSTYRFGGK